MKYTFIGIAIIFGLASLPLSLFMFGYTLSALSNSEPLHWWGYMAFAGVAAWVIVAGTAIGCAIAPERPTPSQVPGPTKETK